VKSLSLETRVDKSELEIECQYWSSGVEFSQKGDLFGLGQLSSGPRQCLE
jgi:hypothetical protein